MSDLRPRIWVVVLNWNGPADTLRCLESLLASHYPRYHGVVVDNGSDDDSVQRIRDWAAGRLGSAAAAASRFVESGKEGPKAAVLPEAASEHEPPVLVLLRNDENAGFARGNNLGIRVALEQGADYVFVLNNDAALDPDCLVTLAAFAEEHPDGGLFGPKVLDFPSGAYTQWAATERLTFVRILFTLSPLRRLIFRTPLFRRLFYSGEEPHAVYCLPGSALFFRASALREIGLFDEFTFLYWEEFIVAEKLLGARWKTYIVPNARLWHEQSNAIRKIGARKFIEHVRSERYFYRRYLRMGWPQMRILNMIRFMSYMARSLIDASYRQNLREFLSIYRSP
jgi:GT2 family glycosyltransferase